MFVRVSTLLVALMIRTAIVSNAFQRVSFNRVCYSSSTTAMASAAATASVVKVGDTLPAITLTELTPTSPDGRPEPVDLLALCKGKKVAMFGVPGAFTPGCSKSHLPSFITAQSDLKAKGIDMTICVATNDGFVMEVSWSDMSSSEIIYYKNIAFDPNTNLKTVHPKIYAYF
jgi:Redoxin